jgi:hypothetical protein
MTIERNEFQNLTALHALSVGRILRRRQRYDHPRDVLATALPVDEKRSILAAWASDLFAVDSRPDLRKPPGFRRPIRCQDILDALRSLDDRWDAEAGDAPRDGQAPPGRRS